MDSARLGSLERLVGATADHPQGALLVYRSAPDVRLWSDPSGELAAAAALSGTHLQFDVRPDAWDALAAEVLSWAASRAGANGVAVLSTRAAEQDPLRLALLDAAGFVREERVALRFVRRLDGVVPAPSCPPGFAVRPVVGEEELASYVALHQEAFGEGPTAEARRRAWRDPSYDPELNLVATTADGALVGFCWCTVWPGGADAAWVELMGTRPTHRRRGLGRALLREGLSRLAARGVRTVGLETGEENPARHLYASEGFVLRTRVLRLRRPVDGP